MTKPYSPTWPWVPGPVQCSMCLRRVDGAWQPQGKCGRTMTICPACLYAHNQEKRLSALEGQA